ncbi:MAG: Gfo/Idh/MocA family oxidoreductase [Erythrobacter sp.]|uniref:Gfo/Idh/MocA family protein n=1 Tax=Erythrobacter sp. TaxID=1042 RepID=UPI0025FA963F|nr:Gfo/Idh/MocA family oxidoreductase [Erythrobacter sp.]MCM0000279.1 Gfo/Idh/MocA family oxidoreductase [Erythrobacter sp.]
MTLSRESRPRLGFLGTGWIGRHRLEAIAATGAAEIVALVDPAEDCAREALALAPGAAILSCYESLLDAGLDGVVIATPSALHAEQAIAALERGVAVFCQKPLGRTAAETARVVEAAETADRLLGVDLSYRHTKAARALAALVEAGELGTIFAADLVFHNAYGPDKAWFRDPALSGGGCVIDLGSHLVDLALWLTGFPAVEHVSARLFAGGEPFARGGEVVEDHALARLDLATGAAVRIACSWNLHAGEDARIEASFHGTKGGARLRNVAGSFYDFELARFTGTATEPLVSPPDDWGGRAAAGWARALATSPRFDPEAHRFTAVAAVIDRIYGAADRA